MLTDTEQAKIAQLFGVSRSNVDYRYTYFGSLQSTFELARNEADLELVRASLARIADLEQKIIDNDQNLIVSSVENGEAELTPNKVIIMLERHIAKEVEKIKVVLGFRWHTSFDGWY